MSGWQLVRARARLADTCIAAVATILGLMCLIPLYASMSWLPPAIVMVLVIALVGAGSRAIAMPIPLVPVAELVGLVGTVTVMYAADQAWAKVVPTSQAWDVIRHLISIGMADAQSFSAPVPVLPQLVLLTVGGAGLVALSVDSLFVSVRSPILGGLPLLGLYLWSAIVLFGQAPWWQFAPAAIGWLLLLAADQREQIRQWGDLEPTTRVTGLSAAARRTGAVAIAVAVLAGLVLPVRALSPLLGGGGTGGGATKVAAGPVVLDPLVSMRRSLLEATDTEVLRYRTNNPKPPYMRVTALEAFDGVTWQPRPALAEGRVDGMPLPGDVINHLSVALPEYHVRGGASYSYLFSVTSLQNSYLPLPYPITNLEDLAGLRSNWRLDPQTGVAFSDGKPATGLKYGVNALDPAVRPAELRAAAPPLGQLWPQLSVPSSVSPQVRQMAIDVTSGASTPYDKAVALQKWFTEDGGFRYSTSVRSGADADYLMEFLTDRIGYCEQYAAAMALMARTLGIPSRVVVGFTQGTQDDTGTWVVTVRDAHAWPELWFDGIGWVRFEPTPRSDATVQAPAYAPSTPNTGAADADLRRLRNLDDATRLGVAPATRSGSLASVAAMAGVGLLLVALLGLTVPAVLRLVRRRRRLHARSYAAVVQGAWVEVGDTAIDLGQPWAEVSTPRQAADRLSRGMPAPATEALTRLRVQVEQVRYGRPPLPGIDAAAQSERSAAVRADVRTVSASLRERVRWQTRAMSYCWPPSVRRRQRSSSRSMKPGDFGGAGAAGVPAASSAAGREPNAE